MLITTTAPYKELSANSPEAQQYGSRAINPEATDRARELIDEWRSKSRRSGRRYAWAGVLFIAAVLALAFGLYLCLTADHLAVPFLVVMSGVGLLPLSLVFSRSAKEIEHGASRIQDSLDALTEGRVIEHLNSYLIPSTGVDDETAREVARLCGELRAANKKAVAASNRLRQFKSKVLSAPQQAVRDQAEADLATARAEESAVRQTIAETIGA